MRAVGRQQQLVVAGCCARNRQERLRVPLVPYLPLSRQAPDRDLKLGTAGEVKRFLEQGVQQTFAACWRSTDLEWEEEWEPTEHIFRYLILALGMDAKSDAAI